MRGQFESLAAKPNLAGGLKNRTLLEALHQLNVEHAQELGRSQARARGRSPHHFADHRIEIAILFREMFLQKRG